VSRLNDSVPPAAPQTLPARSRKQLAYRAGALLLGQLPLRPVGHLYTTAPPQAGHIPNVVRQTWNTAAFGRTHAAYLARFRAMNASWRFELTDDAGCDAYMEANHAGEAILDVYRSARIGPLRTDIWRYAVLWRHGGVYCDVNKMLTVPLNELIAPNDRAVIAAEDTPLLQPVSWQTDPLPARAREQLQHPDLNRLNWCLAFEPGHPFLARALERIVETWPCMRGRPFDDVKAAVVDWSGPRMWTRAIADVIARDPSVPFTQAGLNFHGLGDQNIRYSWVRYLQRPSYRHLPGQVIAA
jgi:mannosyltransferase OCH1-like enzyme